MIVQVMARRLYAKAVNRKGTGHNEFLRVRLFWLLEVKMLFTLNAASWYFFKWVAGVGSGGFRFAHRHLRGTVDE